MRKGATAAAAALTSFIIAAGAAAQSPTVAPLDPAFQSPATTVPPPGVFPPPTPGREIIGGGPLGEGGISSPAERARRAQQAPAEPQTPAAAPETRAARPAPGQALLRQRQLERTRTLEEQLLGRRAPPPSQAGARRAAPEKADPDPMRQLGMPAIREVKKPPNKDGKPDAPEPGYAGFDRFDRNGDGYISYNEYSGLRNRAPVVGLRPTANDRMQRIDQAHQRRFRAADADRDGRVSADEAKGIRNPRF